MIFWVKFDESMKERGLRATNISHTTLMGALVPTSRERVEENTKNYRYLKWRYWYERTLFSAIFGAGFGTLREAVSIQLI